MSILPDTAHGQGENKDLMLIALCFNPMQSLLKLIVAAGMYPHLNSHFIIP